MCSLEYKQSWTELDITVNSGSIPLMSTMKFIKIIDREYNMVELPCGKVTNSLDITKLDMNNEIGNIIVRYNNEQEIIKEWENTNANLI